MALVRVIHWLKWLPPLFFLSFGVSNGDVSRELVFEIIENVPEGTLVGVIRGPLPPYLIVGTDSDLSIDQSNGEIRTKIKLDREVRDLYSFVAIPINGESVRILIHVKDFNDNAPIFTSSFMSVEFPENTPRDVKRTLLPAKDKDLDLFNTQRYVITSGNVNNAFRLSSHRERDGILYLDLQVNGFLDRETIPSYNLIIDAFDGGIPPLKGSMTVHVTLSDVNDNSPIFNQSRYFATICENATIGTSVLQVFATDTDLGPNGKVTYAINRRQTDKDSIFKIEAMTGVISVNRPLDYELKEVHELVVLARDSGLQSLETTVFVSIRVIDVNDHQPLVSLIFLTVDGTANVSEGAQLGEFVARVNVADPDSKIDYSNVNITLTGSRGHFGLNRRNGVVYIVVTSKGIDREKIPEYTLTLGASDTKIPTLNATTTFRLQVIDVNDNAPSFSDSEFYTSVLEVAEPGTPILQMNAYDADLGNNSHLSYELEGVKGSHSHWFEIDKNSGLITTKGIVDCETEAMPRVKVIVRDSGLPSMFSAAIVYIQIRDVNDNEPLFDQSFYNVSILEDTPLGTCILKVSATDPDCGINAIVNYTIRENNSKRLPLSLNATSGELCVEGALDYEERRLYEISVVAADAGGLSSTAIVRIQLLDVNDNDPLFYPKMYETTISEDGKTGTHVVTVKATDPDQNSKLTYSITHGNNGNHFSISSDKGEGRITISHPLNTKSGRKFNLTVKANDGGGRYCFATVTIYVIGSNSRNPIFEKGRYNFSVGEDVAVYSVVGTVSATSPGDGRLRYSISSGDPHAYFTIETTTGVIKTANFLDHEKYASILLNIQAMMSDAPSGFSHTQVEINIIDVNDNAPTFESTEVSIWVAESVEVGAVIYVVHAIDGDSGNFGRVEYKLLEGSPKIFKLDNRDGQISLVDSLDYEMVKRYSLIIGATDHGSPRRNSSNFTVYIEVQDVNDNGPIFEKEKYTVTVSEALPVNSEIVVVHALDGDTGNNARISYNLLEEELKKSFGIFPSTGLLYLKASLDREALDKYTMNIVATDHGVPPLSSTATLTIMIADENDNDPHFVKSFYKFSIPENNEGGSVVGAVKAVDDDIGENGAIRYYLQPFRTHFQIDPVEGTITATISLDREKEDLYELQVVAHDQGLPQRQVEVIVHIRVTDLNDCTPRIVEPEEDRLIIQEEQPQGTEVTRIVAVDGDNGTNSTLLYSLLSDGYAGNGGDVFSIDQFTGVIRTKSILKYEKKQFYTLTVRVTDTGYPPLETIQEYRVDVIELENLSQTFSRTKFNFKVSEKATIGQLVGTLRLNDEKVEYNRTPRIAYILIRGNSEGNFEFDKRTGEILISKKLNYEEISKYEFQVRVLDNSLGNNQQRNTIFHVTIEVSDENDERPMFPKDPVYISVAEDVEIGSVVFNFSAVDLDDGLNGLVHYSILSQEPKEKFRINILTGVLYVQGLLDYEMQQAYILVICATDQTVEVAKRLNSSITVQISIDDVNDNTPFFVSSSKITIFSGENIGTESWIHTVIAVDADSGLNGHVTYGIISGNVAGIFELDVENGHFSLVKGVHLSGSPYTLNISATDNGSPPRLTSQLFHVIVDQLKTHPPQFRERRYEVKIQENSVLGTQVLKVTAVTSDQRSNNTLIYVLPEAMADGKFAIHPSSGSISLTGIIDRESRGEYLMPVYVHDSRDMSLYDTTTLAIQILDVNDNAPRLTCSPLRIPENQDLGLIHTFSASDSDLGRNGDVSYFITSGNAENLFSIDLHSGQFKSRPLDRERRGTYHLVITAQDQGQPVQRTSCNLTLTVTDENDNSPVFVEAHYLATIREDVSIGTTVLVVEASDADVGINSALTYSLSNASNWHFTIENKTGAIVVAGLLDRERIREYTFEVVATDGGLYDSRSSKAQVRIILNDINDNRPHFTTHNPAFVQISPHAKRGQNIFEVKARDVDDGMNGDVLYSLETQNTKFSIHSQSGVITVAENLSSDSGRVVELKVVAKDHGNPSLSSRAIVVVQIGEVPTSQTLKFTEEKYEAKIYENAPLGTTVLHVTALRNDGRRQKIFYAIVAGNEEFGFEIKSATGEIRIQNSSMLDRERVTHFNLIISAQTESETPLIAHTLVNVRLLDENDSVPQFTQDFYMAAVWEGNSKGAFAIQVSAVDADEGVNANLIYYIVDGNEDNAFVIDPPYSGIVKTNIVLDREIQDKYRLTIIATDEGSPQMSGACLLQINVIDVNDNLPIFPPHSVVSVSEGSSVGSHVTTMVANDVDTSPDLVYGFTGSGNPNGIFSIGKYDGRILLVEKLDYELKKQHLVQVQVSDGVHMTVTNLTVNVMDENDNAPKFGEMIYEVVISGDTEIGSEILHVNASDLDTELNARIKYSLLVPNNAKSRAIGRNLHIDEDTGVTSTNSSMARKEISFAELILVAMDTGTPKLLTKSTLWVQIRPSEFDLIKFTADKYTVNITKDVVPGTQILKLDVNYNRQVKRDYHFHYAITAGNSNDLFTIASHTGELLMARRLKDEENENYLLRVTVSCVSDVKCRSTATVSVQVIPLDTQGPTFNQSVYSISVSEKKSIGSTLFRLPSSAMTSLPLTYEVTSGGNPRTFELNSKTGVLSLKGLLDYEVTSTYKIVVCVKNQKSGLWTLVTIEVEVEDANEHSPHFPLESYIEFIGENEPIGTSVFTARAIDLDGGPYGKLNYSILENSAKEKFRIDPTTGIVKTATIFDYESLNRYHFTLRAHDIGGLSTTVKIQVEIESRDEYVPEFTQKIYRFIIPSNAGAGHVVGYVRASDEDHGVDGFITYQITQQNGHFKINRTSGGILLKAPLNSDLNTSLVILASSGQLDSKTTKALAEISIGSPSAELGVVSGSGVPDWLIGVLITALLILFLIATLFIVLHFRRKKRSDNGKSEDVFNSTKMFDTLEYAQSTMIAGASSRPTSLYSPQYSDLVDLGLSGRRIAGNPSSELSNKSNSASSGRGSAEDGEEVEDEEIRMINEGRLEEQKLRDSIGIPDSGIHDHDEVGSVSSVKNTQEYLARLGIRQRTDYPEDGRSEWASSSLQGDAMDTPNMFESATSRPFDLTTLIYSQIPDDDESHVVGESRECTKGHPSITGSLSSIIHGEEELTSYNWEYLQHWGPQYQPLAHVFSEIARLNDDVTSNRSEGHYSGVHPGRGSLHMGTIPSSNESNSIKSGQSGQSSAARSSRRVKTSPNPTNTSQSSSSKSQHSKSSSHHQPPRVVEVSGVAGNSNQRGPLPALPILPRSPITADDPTYMSPLSPSFSPELSFCSSPPGIPDHSVGIRTAHFPPTTYSSSDSSELRL